jgi:hypothetical protein
MFSGFTSEADIWYQAPHCWRNMHLQYNSSSMLGHGSSRFVAKWCLPARIYTVVARDLFFFCTVVKFADRIKSKLQRFPLPQWLRLQGCCRYRRDNCKVTFYCCSHSLGLVGWRNSSDQSRFSLPIVFRIAAAESHILGRQLSWLWWTSLVFVLARLKARQSCRDDTIVQNQDKYKEIIFIIISDNP